MAVRGVAIVDGGSVEAGPHRVVEWELLVRHVERRAVALVVLHAVEVARRIRVQHLVVRVEHELSAFVVLEAAARGHSVLGERREVLRVALAQRVRHGEAVGERVVALAVRAVEGKQLERKGKGRRAGPGCRAEHSPAGGCGGRRGVGWGGEGELGAGVEKGRG